jgi:acid phosphatase family membrane protein YuiD
MNWIQQLYGNKVLISGFSAWVIAQILKAVIYAVINRKIHVKRLVGDGGMPSSHSATVTALATTCALNFGPGSFEFGVTVILAFIVMHDAMGVRKETGKHAVVINDMIEFLEAMGGKDLTPEDKLKEFVGHSPVQVFVGAILGLTVAFVIG